MTTLAAPKLTSFQHLLLAYFESQKHKSQGICSATATIAAKFGKNVDHVRRTIKELIEFGLIDRLWDYTLRTRRRFYLAGSPYNPQLPFGVADSEAPFPVASALPDSSPTLADASFLTCASAGHSPAPAHVIADSPLDPPNKDSGENLLQESGGASLEPEPPPLPVESAPPQEETPVLASPLAAGLPDEIHQRAARIAPVVTPALSRKLETFLARWGRPWLLAAFDRADRLARAQPIRDLGSYLGRTLEGFGHDGAAPDPQPSPEELAARKEALYAAWTEKALAWVREAYQCGSG